MRATRPGGKASLFLLLGFVGTCATAQIYKWTDEQGHVHYGEKPPDGATATQIQRPSGGGAAQSSSGTYGSIPASRLPQLPPEEEERRRRIIDRMDREQEEKERVHFRDSPDGQRLCAMMRSQMASAQSGVLRGTDGDVRLTAEQQRQALASLRSQYDRACR